MRLHSGSSQQFIEDAVHNRIAGKLKAAFFEHFGYNPSPAELASWQNSSRAISMVFEHARLTDHGVLLEYQLPLTSRRLDCMICGHDADRRENAVIVELKQWEQCGEADGENEVTAWVGGAERHLPPWNRSSRRTRLPALDHTGGVSLPGGATLRSRS